MMRTRILKILATGIFLCLFIRSGAASPQDAVRSRTLLNGGWMYSEARNILPGSTISGDTWERVDLPHSWNVWDAVDQIPGYRRDVSWYARRLEDVQPRPGRRYLLDFEGVNLECDIYVNGQRAGGHVGGYVGFTIDITSYLHAEAPAMLMIRVSNAYNPNLIPSQKSDFFLYGGITRDVWLLDVPDTYLSSMTIRTPHVRDDQATTRIEIGTTGHTPGLTVECSLLDPQGRTITSASGRMDRTGMSVIDLEPIRDPRLWSPDDPALYTVRAMLMDGSTVIDEIRDRIGYRWYEFREHDAFYLNGKRLLLRGTHRHEDFAGYANAMPDSLHRLDMQMIKDMGANFVRLGHYPQDPEVYRACDELGLLVWDELPWCRGGMGGSEWRANTTRLLREQILRYYNHPSIFIRSLGNEMYWLPDFPGGGNVDSLRAMIAELNQLSHRLDPERLTATRKFTEGADLVDLVSPSIWPGWYSGYYKMFQPAYEDARQRYARFFHAEFGGSSHVGRHSEVPISGDGIEAGDGWEENIELQKVKNVARMSDWNENYIVDLFDWSLHVSENTPWLTGNAQWAFKDFPTPLRPENPIPYMNQKGLVDRSGRPKDAYYVFKSYWTSDPPFCYIESHTWTERTGPKDAVRDICIFSNCEEVELFHNGSSLGRKTRDRTAYPAQGLHWPVRLSEGKNVFHAVGSVSGAIGSRDSLNVTYGTSKNGTAQEIELSARRLSGTRFLLTATVVDTEGRRCLDYEKRVYFTADGPGRLIENMGTPLGSSVIEFANGRATIEFLASPDGPTVIEVRNQDFKGTYIRL